MCIKDIHKKLCVFFIGNLIYIINILHYFNHAPVVYQIAFITFLYYLKKRDYFEKSELNIFLRIFKGNSLGTRGGCLTGFGPMLMEYYFRHVTEMDSIESHLGQLAMPRSLWQLAVGYRGDDFIENSLQLFQTSTTIKTITR